jgi:integrase
VKPTQRIPLLEAQINAELINNALRLSSEGLVFIKKREPDRSNFAVISLWGKFGGLNTCGATFPYIVPLPNIFLTRLFSKRRLKRKDFQEILRLPWAQEASGSNPDAPTTKMTQKVVWHVVKQYAGQIGILKLAPHDLRRSCARLCHRAGGELEQIQFLLGYVSVQTTEKYLGCKQRLREAVNDQIGIEPGFENGAFTANSAG